MNFGFRDESLNARNAFAPVRGPEQQKRFMVNFQGPLAKGKTGLSIAMDGNMAYDARTIVARTPTGEVNDQIRRPVDAVNVNVRLEHALSPTSSLRAEYARRENTRRNLGVGDFDLLDRAYSSDTVTDLLRVRNTRTIGKKAVQRAAVRADAGRRSLFTSASDAPTIRVLDDFTTGGAGQSGARDGRQFTVAQNFDFSVAKHMLRAGVLVEGGWWDSTQQSNANGTFTFSSLDEFLAGRPRTYTRRVGDPERELLAVRSRLVHPGRFPRRARTSTSASAFARKCRRTLDDAWNLAPRAAFTWALRQGQRARRLRDVLRLAGGQRLRADRARGRHAADRRGHRRSRRIPTPAPAPARRWPPAGFNSGRS